MNFREHSELKDKHAFLAPSKYHWINYDIAKLGLVYRKQLMSERGTRFHALACELITLGVRLPRTKETLNMYVNDAIAMHLKPEITLRYSSNCFGTTDAINFENMFLRISDYKSGETPASMHQLEVYESLFCLEYDYSPFDIGSELRIYQNNEKIRYTPAPERIQGIMDNIIIFDREIERIMSEE